MFTIASEEPLEITDSDSSSSLYLCWSDSSGLNQESQILGESSMTPCTSKNLHVEMWTAISRGRLNRLSKHLRHLFLSVYCSVLLSNNGCLQDIYAEVRGWIKLSSLHTTLL